MAPIPEYKPDPPSTPKGKKNEEGQVELGPLPFKVSPMKKGKCSTNRKGDAIYFGGNIPYVASDYNIDRKIAKDELDYHNSKI